MLPVHSCQKVAIVQSNKEASVVWYYGMARVPWTAISLHRNKHHSKGRALVKRSGRAQKLLSMLFLMLHSGCFDQTIWAMKTRISSSVYASKEKGVYCTDPPSISVESIHAIYASALSSLLYSQKSQLWKGWRRSCGMLFRPHHLCVPNVVSSKTKQPNIAGG